MRVPAHDLQATHQNRAAPVEPAATLTINPWKRGVERVEMLDEMAQGHGVGSGDSVANFLSQNQPSKR